jgi:hypothetical protein
MPHRQVQLCVLKTHIFVLVNKFSLSRALIQDNGSQHPNANGCYPTGRAGQGQAESGGVVLATVYWARHRAPRVVLRDRALCLPTSCHLLLTVSKTSSASSNANSSHGTPQCLHPPDFLRCSSRTGSFAFYKNTPSSSSSSPRAPTRACSSGLKRPVQ